jgi:hypothetical protein
LAIGEEGLHREVEVWLSPKLPALGEDFVSDSEVFLPILIKQVPLFLACLVFLISSKSKGIFCLVVRPASNLNMRFCANDLDIPPTKLWLDLWQIREAL